MASIASPYPSPGLAARAWQRLRGLIPAEGIVTVILHAVLLIATSWAIERAAGAPERFQLSLIAVLALLVGLALAKLRTPDLLAHLIALWTGLVVIVAIAFEQLPTTPGGRRERLALLGEAALGWYRDFLSSRPIDDPLLFAMLLGLTAWLVAYTSAWVLYRRGWLTTAIVLPGVIILVNLGYSPAGGSWPLLVFIVAACVLAVRYHVYRRELVWAQSRLQRPPRLPGQFLITGLTIALVVGSLAWTVPLNGRAELLNAIWQRVQPQWNQVAQQVDDLLSRFAGPGQLEGGSYANFGEQFQLGGALNLSDDPVLLLEPVAERYRSTYLIGYRYDAYTGYGWSTTVNETFEQPPGEARYSPLLSFGRGQGMNLSSGVLTDRSQVVSNLRVLRPKGNLIFTTDTYLTSDLQTSVQLPWQQVEGATYSLTSDTESPEVLLNRIPVELRQFAALLLRASFPPDSDSPMPLDPAQAAEVETARSRLADQRFLDVSWTAGTDGRAAGMTVTGQLPVYDDVEAVFSRQPVQEDAVYSVTALASTADPAALAAAGTDYPAWVADRYLQLPDTVTARTRALAEQLAAGQASPFDVALAVQTYVRQAITYNEDITAPPRDQDVVDYVLFDSRQGYCEYYASSMAVLLRAVDIPARVVGGYFPAPYDADAGGFLYREKNAHLWVEVFFPGYGWIPFEPTASQETLSYGDVQMSDVPPTPAPTPSPVASATAAAAVTPEATPTAAGTTEEPAATPPADRVFGLIALAVIALVGAVSLIISLLWLWGFRGLSPTGGFYARLLRVGRWGGVAATPAMTPQEYATALGRAIPASARPARTLADLYNQETFAGRAPASSAVATARQAWVQLRRAVIRTLLRRPPRIEA